MKVRTDFISNSSSTSFVVAINNNYKLNDFCKDIAKKTVNEKSEFHNPNLQFKNEINLLYCLMNYELLFLGSYLYNVDETIYIKENLPIKIDDQIVFSEAEWKYYENEINKWNKIKNNPEDPNYAWMKDEFEMDYIKDGALHLFYKNRCSGYSLNTMHEYCLKYDNNDIELENLIKSGKADEQQKKVYADTKNSRLNRIKELVKNNIADYRNETPGSYQITLNTIKTTREMLNAGLTIDFDTWENIDKIEKRLKNGEKLFVIQNNYSGDGYLIDGVFSEENSEGFQNIAMEYLNSEYS